MNPKIVVNTWHVGCKNIIVPTYEYGSETSNNLSWRNFEAPWAIWQSRSISPKRRPPSRDLPSIGCLFKSCNGPRARLKSKLVQELSNRLTSALWNLWWLPVDFIVDHVLETLVICWAKENLCIHFTSSKSTINYFITTLLIFVIVQQVRHLGDK